MANNNAGIPDGVGQQPGQQHTQQQYGVSNQQPPQRQRQQQQSRYNPLAQSFQGHTTQQYANSYQYGNRTVDVYGTNHGPVGQAQSWYPNAPYNPNMAAAVPSSYYPTPGHSYSYAPQTYSSPMNTQPPYGTAYQTWPAQPPYSYTDYYAGWGAQPQPEYFHQNYAEPWNNSSLQNMQANWSNDAMQNELAFDLFARPHQAHRPDKYRPAYASKANSVLPSDNQPQSHRPLMASRPGPPGKRRFPGSTMEPLSSYVKQMADYERKYPKPPAYSDPFALSPDIAPSTQRRVPGVGLANATKFTPGHRRLSEIEKTDLDVQETPTDAKAVEQIVDGQQTNESQAKPAQAPSNSPQQTLANEKLNFTPHEHANDPSKLLKKASLPDQAPAGQASKRVRDCMDPKAQPDTSSGHQRLTTDSSMSSPPPKRVKEEPVSQAPKVVKQNTATTPEEMARPADNDWGNFYAHIRQDDKDMVVKSRQDLERLGGEAFRPEIRETYKDHRGKTEMAVHEKVAGDKQDKEQGPEEDEDENEGGVKIDS